MSRGLTWRPRDAVRWLAPLCLLAAPIPRAATAATLRAPAALPPAALVAATAVSETARVVEREVSASPSTHRARDFPRTTLPVVTLAHGVLRSRTRFSIARTAEAVVGVRSESPNDPLAGVVVRGMGGNRVLLLDRGLPVYTFQIPDLDGPCVDAALSGRVTVARGGMSAQYGGGALAGVIEVEPLESDRSTVSAIGNGLRAGGEMYGASGDRGLGGAAHISGSRQGLDFRGSLAGRRAADLTTPGGAVDRLDFGAHAGEAGIAYSTGSGTADVSYTSLGGTFDLPLDPATTPRSRSLRRTLGDRRLQWSGSLALAEAVLGFRGQWQHRELDASVRNDGRPPLAMELDASTLELFGRRAGPRWSTLVDVSGTSQVTRTTSPQPLVPDGRVIAGAVLGAEEYRSGRWLVSAAARLDVRHLEAQGNPFLALTTQSRGFDAWSGGLGARYQLLERLALSMSATTGWRAPSLLELYAHGSPLGRDWFELGARDLDLERGITLDAGAGWDSGRVRGEVRVFRQWNDRYLDLDATGETWQGLPVYRYGARAATLSGGEATLAGDLSRIFSVAMGLDYVTGQDETHDRPLSAIPPPRGIVEAYVHGAPAAWTSDARLGVRLESHGRATRLGALDTPSAPYALVHLESEVTWREAFRVGIGIANVTNRRYNDFLTRNRAIALGAGRQVLVWAAWDR